MPMEDVTTFTQEISLIYPRWIVLIVVSTVVLFLFTGFRRRAHLHHRSVRSRTSLRLMGAVMSALMVLTGMAVVYVYTARHAPAPLAARLVPDDVDTVSGNSSLDRRTVDPVLPATADHHVVVSQSEPAVPDSQSPLRVWENSYSPHLNVETAFATITSETGKSVILPEWTKTSGEVSQISDTTRFVLTSGRYSTQAEGEAELLQDLLPRVISLLPSLQPHLDRRTIERAIHPELLKKLGLVKRQCVAAYGIQVGEFNPQVLQVFWDVEFNPENTQQLAAACRPLVLHERLLKLGGVLGVMTLALGVLSTFLRRYSSRT